MQQNLGEEEIEEMLINDQVFITQKSAVPVHTDYKESNSLRVAAILIRLLCKDFHGS